MSVKSNSNAEYQKSGRLAYFDCFSGISGDMVLGALVDLGLPIDWLEASLREQLMLKDIRLTTQSVMRQSIRAQAIAITAKDNQPARHYAAICELIGSSRLSDTVKEKSLAVFDCIAEAEARIHGCDKEMVHFHEVGGIDAIVDIVGATIGMEYFNIQRIMASRIATGNGWVTCRHGKLPVPAPATLQILKGRPVYGIDIAHELVTPTGAALLVSLAETFGCIPTMTVEGIGYGAGAGDFESHPNVLRVLLGTAKTDLVGEAVVVETCIDDMNPEIFGYVMERLFDDGALDVYWIPIFMKKNRPGTKIQVLCTETDKDRIVNRILSETTSLGVRFYGVQRRILDRELITIDSQYGTVTVKKVTLPNGDMRWIPEYDDCRKIAVQKGIPIREVYEAITNEIGISSKTGLRSKT